MKTTYIVKAFYDREAEMWGASRENFTGVATEAKSFDDLLRKLNSIVPEMLEANGYIGHEHDDIPYRLISDCVASNPQPR